jgi:hypothetical protein
MGGLTEILIFGIIGVVLAFKPFGIFGAPH